MQNPAELRAIQLCGRMAYNGEVIELDVENFCASTGASLTAVKKALADQGLQVVAYEVPQFKPYYMKARSEVAEMGRAAKMHRLHERVEGGSTHV